MTLREMLMRKINGVPVEAHTDLSNLTGGEVLKWDSTNTLMAWEDQDSTGYVPWVFQGDTYGFHAGNTASDVINRFAFASNTTATDWGNLTSTRYLLAGCSSSTDGFTAGGGPTTNIIDKFSFTSSSGASDHGDLNNNTRGPAGSSSTTQGFASGGEASANVIDKFDFTDPN